MAVSHATTSFARTPPKGPPESPSSSADVPPLIEEFATRQGWQERARRAISFVSDHVLLSPPAFVIAWVFYHIGRIFFNLLVYKRFRARREQDVVQTAADRMDVYAEEGRLAPGFHVHPPYNPHSPPSTLTSRSPLAPPTLRPRDLIVESPPLPTSHRSSKEKPPPLRSRAEATPAGTESAYPVHSIRPQAHSVPLVVQVSEVRHAPDLPHSSSTDHPPPSSPFVEWTRFFSAGTANGEDIRKRSRQIVFCGGFSDIFRAEIRFGAPAAGPELRQDFALKILRRVGLDGREEDQVFVRMIERLNQEAMTWIRLQHPNVVPLVGFTIMPLPSLISPWYERGNIRNYLKLHPAANRLKLIYDVAKGLEYLHSRTPRIVHGDIKPANVLINKKEDALLSDFGLATALGEEDRYTPSHRDGGSIRYMAPELLLGEYHRTCNADVYSFASLAFEVLTSHPPHRQLTTDGQISVFMANPKGPEYPIDDWSLYPELEPIEGILRRCWSRIPDGRPSMKEIVEELSVIVQGTDA